MLFKEVPKHARSRLITPTLSVQDSQRKHDVTCLTTLMFWG